MVTVGIVPGPQLTREKPQPAGAWSGNPWTPLIVATFGWALSVVVSRAIVLRGVAAVTLVPLRLAVAMLALLILVAASPRFRSTSPTAWKYGIVLGVLGMAMPNMVLTRALEDLPASLGGLLIALIPIATVVAAHFIVKERFRPRAIPGLVIALIGSAILVGAGGDTLEGVDNLWRGVAFSLSGVVLAGLNGALTRKFALNIRGEELVLPQFTSCTLALFLVVPVFFDFDVSTVDRESWWLIVIMGTVGTVVPFAAFLVGASVNPSWRLGLTGYTVPVLAVALAILFLGESLTLPVVVGAFLIVGGVVIADRASRRRAGTLPPV